MRTNLPKSLLLDAVSYVVSVGFRPTEAGRTILPCRKPKRILRYGAPVDSLRGGVSRGVVRPVSRSFSESVEPE